jgi:hypothetical protein
MGERNNVLPPVVVPKHKRVAILVAQEDLCAVRTASVLWPRLASRASSSASVRTRPNSVVAQAIRLAARTALAAAVQVIRAINVAALAAVYCRLIAWGKAAPRDEANGGGSILARL